MKLVHPGTPTRASDSHCKRSGCLYLQSVQTCASRLPGLNRQLIQRTTHPQHAARCLLDDMGVEHGCLQVRVAQESLDRADVVAVFELLVIDLHVVATRLRDWSAMATEQRPRSPRPSTLPLSTAIRSVNGFRISWPTSRTHRNAFNQQLSRYLKE